MDENVEQVVIDASYELKVYFDEKFKEVQKEDTHRYLLFANVDPGNTLISFETFSGKVFEKIIHVSDGEIFFDVNTFVRGGVDSISLYERGIFSKLRTELQIRGKDIKYFNKEVYAKLKGLNVYEYKRPGLPLGMRKYLKLDHLDESIFVGAWEKKEVEVPGKDFIKQVIKFYGTDYIAGLGERCVIQLNLDNQDNLRKKIVKFEEKRFLDKDGELGETPAILTEIIFLFGEVEGLVNGKIEYFDGTFDFFQTYCKGNTYLIEQF